MKSALAGSWVEVGFLEARMLHRLVRGWIPVVFLLWALLLRVQEPWFLRRQGVSIYWSGIELGMLLLAALLPWTWASLSASQREWSLGAQAASSARIATSACVLYCYMIAWGVLLLAGALAVDGLWGHADFSEGTRLALAWVILLLPIAAAAPGLAALGSPMGSVTLLWAVAWILSFQFGAPFPIGSSIRPELGPAPASALSWTAMPALPSSVLASLCATLGGLAFSLGITKLRR